MLVLFEVVVVPGRDGDALLSEEVLSDTQAQVMTLAQAAAVGFSGAQPDPKGREIRLIAAAPRDEQFISRRLEAADAVASFRIHRVEG